MKPLAAAVVAVIALAADCSDDRSGTAPARWARSTPTAPAGAGTFRGPDEHMLEVITARYDDVPTS